MLIWAQYVCQMLVTKNKNAILELLKIQQIYPFVKY